MREQNATDTIRKDAVPLEDALARGMVEATPVAAHSSRTEMMIRLKPLVGSQPWIRIDPGWEAGNQELSRVGFVTAYTVYVRLPKRKDYRFKLRHVRTHFTRSAGLPEDSTLAKLDDERLIGFLKATGDVGVDPDWKLVQFGVWALTDDISFQSVRPPTDVNHQGFRSNQQFATAGQIQMLMKLLAGCGHDRQEFALWREMVAELEQHVVAYEAHWDSDTAKAYLPFQKICNFYPLDVAAEIMFSAFDRHEGDAGREFRAYVVGVLGEDVGPREREQLQKRASYESDPAILASMQGLLNGVPAAPPK